MANVLEIPRSEFLSEGYWDYRAGEHVTILGPTDCGKTTLGLELLQRTATPELPGLVLVMKPRDKTISRWLAQSEFRKVTTWSKAGPPAAPWRKLMSPGRANPPGYVLWPRHVFDPDVDDVDHYWVFRDAILESYKRGNRILFADETYSLEHDLNPGLRRELRTVWTKGRAMGCGQWAMSQQPAWISTLAYNSAGHLFLAKDPDWRARKRFGEISGQDGRLIEDIVMSLRFREFLYIRQRDKTMCVVNA